MSATSGTGLPTRAAQKVRTRRRLLEAARHTFAEQGYARTTITDLARGAGVATGTFYVHFESKEAVVDESPDA
ncbi:MAG: TetR family transcriptional regulator [Myxococcota bacterium]